MFKVLIAATNYNSEKKLINYLNTINEALYDLVELSVVIGDNSTFITELDTERYDFELIYCFNDENLGYIGGITNALQAKEISIKEFDFVIFSNVDVELTKSFFRDLEVHLIKDDVGWIAPSIISLNEGKDRNPKLIQRYPRWKILFFIGLYFVPYLKTVYNLIIYNRKKTSFKPRRMDIYGGHGSFMIFKKAFVNSQKSLAFPSFLFGEEIYYAELVSMAGLRTIYDPNLRIIDYDHESTSLLSSRKKNRMNIESLKMILKHFY